MAVAAVLLLFASTLASIAAQAATPTPGGANALGNSGVLPAGTAVSVVDNTGTPSYTLTVDKLDDPFTGFNPSNAPQRGFHFVAIDISLFNASTAAVTSTGNFIAVDADGFANQQAYVSRVSADGQIDDYSNLSVDPGKVGRAIVFFQVLNDTKITQIVFQPDYQRWITVLDMNKTAISPGTKVSFLDANLQPVADITVTEVIDPLTDFNPSSPPQRGFAYAGINVTIANTGAAALTANSSDFTVVDVDGFTAAVAGVNRTANATAATPDLQSGASIEPGQSLTGVISYQVLKGSKLNQVFYSPQGRFLEVVNLAGKGVQVSATPGPDAAATPIAADANATNGNATDGNGNNGNATAGNATAGNSSTDQPTQAADVPTPDVSGVDCGAVVSWAKTVLVGTLPVFTQVVTDTGGWQATPNAPIDTAKVRADAKLLTDALASIKGASAPDEVKPLAGAYEGILQSFADSLAKLANDLDAKDTAAIKADLDGLNHAADALTDPKITALSSALQSACPDLATING